MTCQGATPVSSRAQKIYVQVLFFLRFIQLGSTTITGFIYCFLVWHHNNHFCAWYPSRCNVRERTQTTVPWAEIVMIAACSASFLEAYISGAYSLYHRQGQPNSRHLPISTAPVVALFAVAYRYYYEIPYVADWCYYNQNQSIYANVELKNCAIVNDAKFSGAIAGLSTTLIFIMSTTVLVFEKLRCNIPVNPAPSTTAEKTQSEKLEPRAVESIMHV